MIIHLPRKSFNHQYFQRIDCIRGLMQERRNPITNALELRLFCFNFLVNNTGNVQDIEPWYVLKSFNSKL